MIMTVRIWWLNQVTMYLQWGWGGGGERNQNLHCHGSKWQKLKAKQLLRKTKPLTNSMQQYTPWPGLRPGFLLSFSTYDGDSLTFFLFFLGLNDVFRMQCETLSDSV